MDENDNYMYFGKTGRYVRVTWTIMRHKEIQVCGSNGIVESKFHTLNSTYIVLKRRIILCKNNHCKQKPKGEENVQNAPK